MSQIFVYFAIVIIVVNFMNMNKIKSQNVCIKKESLNDLKKDCIDILKSIDIGDRTLLIRYELFEQEFICCGIIQ